MSRCANLLAKRWGYKGFDFVKYQSHFEKGLLQELNFKQEVINSERLRDAFQGYESLYLPKMHVLDSTRRVIQMEYVEGLRIDQIDKLNEEFGSARRVTDLLIDIYARMIFIHGHVHCDAHPGNILIRKDAKNQPQIVLLDHGFYCTTGEAFRKDFCKLFYSLMSFNYAETEVVARRMGMGDYFRYMPLLFTLRTIKTKKRIGADLTEEEKQYFKSEVEIDIDKIGMLLQKLPADLVFILRAVRLISVHNMRAKGTTRDRLFTFIKYTCQGLAQGFSPLYYYYLRVMQIIRLVFFERCFWLFDRVFGFKQFSSEFDL